MDISRRLPESPLDISRRLPEPPPSLSLDVITIYITLEPSQSNPTLVCLQHRRDKLAGSGNIRGRAISEKVHRYQYVLVFTLNIRSMYTYLLPPRTLMKGNKVP